MQTSTLQSVLPLIVLQPLQHRNARWIAVKAPLQQSINILLRKLPERKFSKTNKCWLVPLSRENYKTVFYQLTGFATLDTGAMKKWFTENNTTTITKPAATAPPVTKMPVNNKATIIPAAAVKKDPGKCT